MGKLVTMKIKIHLNQGREFSLTLLLEDDLDLDERIFYLPRLYPLKKYGITGNGSQDRMVFCLKLCQWYTKKDDDIPKLIAV